MTHDDGPHCANPDWAWRLVALSARKPREKSGIYEQAAGEPLLKVRGWLPDKN